ncbi:MAG: bifunctional UDP-N-acetylmuramoyl-tripeptide:D-alanyl-D-alanine ligase/alanine racemase [Luteibaculum sp.]
MLPKQASNLQEITGGIWKDEPFFQEEVSVVFTDSRKVYSNKNAVFVALQGPNYDGHQFVIDAYQKGVKQFLVNRFVEELPPDAKQLKVSDTLFALHQWAVFVRKQFFAPVIGVTGSNGKTIFKEWFAHLMEGEIPVFKNPKSYNSQIGVPLSILPLSDAYAMAIFEAGISKPGEMESLERLIRPKIGVFTHLGSAHDEGFESREHKLTEKLKLFKQAKTLLLPSNIKKQYAALLEQELPEITLLDVGSDMDSHYRVTFQALENKTQIVFHSPEEHIFQIPFTDSSSVQNAVMAVSLYMHLRMPVQRLQEKLKQLRAVPMRLSFSRTQGNSVIVNDAYSLDWESLQIALDFLKKQGGQRRSVLILSEPADGDQQPDFYKKLKDSLEKRGIEFFIGVGSEMSSRQPVEQGVYFEKVEELLRALPKMNLSERAILVKGARKFQLERVVSALESQRHQTVLEINLSAINRNFNAIKNTLNPGVKVMAMVKAAAYGGGTVEVANMLENHGVDFIGVAFTQEGKKLRQAGIKTPILVLNPWMDEVEDLIDHQLTPAIYRIETLQYLEKTAKQLNAKLDVHIKVDTGMNRLGFTPHEFEDLELQLKELYHISIRGVYSHFAAADEADFDSFSQEQLKQFADFSEKLEKALNRKILKHICNTSATLRFPDAHFDMVRLGIGLYGYNPSNSGIPLELALTFKTHVSQIRVLEPGQSVGYGRKFIAPHETRMAVLPIGYADGLPRSSGNERYKILFPNIGTAPIIGNVCMDMCMVAIGDLPVREGDRAIVFGPEHPIEELARVNKTIPYEILCGISDRVKRIYYED